MTFGTSTLDLLPIGTCNGIENALPSFVVIARSSATAESQLALAGIVTRNGATFDADSPAPMSGHVAVGWPIVHARRARAQHAADPRRGRRERVAQPLAEADRLARLGHVVAVALRGRDR